MTKKVNKRETTKGFPLVHQELFNCEWNLLNSRCG